MQSFHFVVHVCACTSGVLGNPLGPTEVTIEWCRDDVFSQSNPEVSITFVPPNKKPMVFFLLEFAIWGRL